MDLPKVLQSLMAPFVEQITTFNVIKSTVIKWVNSQTLLIQALFGNISWES